MSPTPQTQAYFVGTPFALTANRELAACWAGRAEVRKRLERLCQSYFMRPDSSLDLAWANLGAGKSHTLLHLMTLLAEGDRAESVITGFVELPEQPRRFLDLYRGIMSELPLDRVGRHLLSDDGGINGDLRRAARALVHGASAERETARDWLLSGKPHLRDLRNATGIGARIEDDVHACAVLSDIIGALARCGLRTVLLLDEFQRIGTSSERQREAILSNLRSVFSRNAAGLSVVVAVTSRIERSAIELMPPQLRSLMGMRPTVSLPELDEEEAFAFIVERFRHFRPIGYSGSPAAPFGEEALRALVSHISKLGRERLIPRTLLQAAGWLYDEALMRGIEAMSAKDVSELLGALHWDE